MAFGLSASSSSATPAKEIEMKNLKLEILNKQLATIKEQITKLDAEKQAIEQQLQESQKNRVLIPRLEVAKAMAEAKCDRNNTPENQAAFAQADNALTRAIGIEQQIPELEKTLANQNAEIYRLNSECVRLEQQIKNAEAEPPQYDSQTEARISELKQQLSVQKGLEHRILVVYYKVPRDENGKLLNLSQRMQPIRKKCREIQAELYKLTGEAEYYTSGKNVDDIDRTYIDWLRAHSTHAVAGSPATGAGAKQVADAKQHKAQDSNAAANAAAAASAAAQQQASPSSAPVVKK